MKSKKTIIFVIVALIILLCVTVTQAGVIEKTKKKVSETFIPSQLIKLENDLHILINKSLPNLPTKVHNDLVMIIYTLYVLLAVFLGHNMVCQFLTKIISSIVVIPIIIIKDLFGMGGIITEALQESFTGWFNLTDIIYNFGIFGLVLAPVIIIILSTAILLTILVRLPQIIGSSILQDIFDTYEAVEW